MLFSNVILCISGDRKGKVPSLSSHLSIRIQIKRMINSCPCREVLFLPFCVSEN